MNIDMNKIMDASFGAASETVRSTFKKTINVKQYETEVVELTSTIEINKNLTGVERMLVCSILQAQLEYEGYIQLACKGAVTQSELVERKKSLEDSVKLLADKAEAILGKPVDYLFEITANSN